MKRFISSFIFFALVLSLAGCNNNDKIYIDGDWEYKIVDNEAIITNYRNISTEVIVPTNLGKYSVAEITGVFGNTKEKLKKVILPDGIKIIGDSTFNGCAELSDFIIPETVTSIKSAAFKGCVNIVKISIPKSVIEIGNFAFEGCARLESISFISTVNTIGRDAFKDTAWYNNQRDGVIYIGDTAYSFKGGSKESSIAIKEGTRVLQLYDIKISGAKSISIPSSVTVISDSAFSGIDTITDIYIEDGLEPLIIENSAFRGCLALTQINLPNRTKMVGDNAFNGCSAILELNFPKGIEKIGSAAFSNMNGLKSIKIPDFITEIGSGAFSNCIGLESVEVKFGPEAIPESMFSGCQNLENVVIHEGITRIEKYAFYECPKLLSVTLPASIERIDSSAFWQTIWHEPRNLHFIAAADSYAEVFAYNHSIIWTEIDS